METSPTTSITPSAAVEPARAATPDAAAVRTLAQQFEAMLLTQMLREMKESMAPDADQGGLGGGILGDTMNSALGLSLSGAGGLGLADVLMKALDARNAAAGPTDVDATAAAAAAAPVPAAAAALPAAPSAGAHVTSAYGWRTDPLNGRNAFHAGVDLRYAYGQDVRAAAAGVVTFAGDRAGYGTTVIIDHGNGLETRYAHLSSADVQPGTAVAAGAVIARSGSSGRSTGPHLHFEVRRDGQPADPETLESRMTNDQ